MKKRLTSQHSERAQAPVADCKTFGKTGMQDYLQPAGRLWRFSCIAASVLAAAMSLSASAFMWYHMFEEGTFQFDGKPLWIGVLILTVVGLAAAFVAIRLTRGSIASNGVTSMPVWFIQSFGGLLLVGVGAVAYDRGDWVFAIRGWLLCVAMIFVSWNIAKRRRKKEPNLK